MKVLQVNILGATLSTGRTTREMHTYFKAHGIESHIACPLRRDCEDAFVFSSKLEVKADYVLTKYTGMEAQLAILPTLRLIRHINRIKPDIVHLRVLHGNCIHLKMLLSYLAKKDIATVITMHDFWYMTGMCFYYTDKHCDRWKTGCGNCPGIPNDIREKKFDRTRTLWRRKQRGFGAIRRLAVIGVSDWVTREVKQSLLASAKLIRRIYNWIDLSTFRPMDGSSLRKAHNLDGKFVILAISAAWRTGDCKGLEYYLQLANEMPDHYRILLVGDMCYDGDLPDKVIAINRTDSKEQLAQYYSMADVYLNLSEQETFGKVSAEAVSCGTPVVAYDVTANGEIVAPDGGIKIQTRDSSNILKALKKIEKTGKAQYQPICRKYAEENFDMETNICQYLDVYQELLDM